MQDTFRLDGKTVLITGGSRGLGLVFARGLGHAGAKVVINGRNETQLMAAVTELSDGGIDAAGFAFDVTDPESVASAWSRMTAEVGEIDILVNNAGIQHRAPLEEFPFADWQKVLQTNLTAPFVVAKQAAQSMIQRRRGKIINICSMQSELGRRTIAPYAASKGGLKMLTRAMAVEWAQYNIQVNGVGPGYFLTEMTKPLADNPEFDSWLKGRTPAGRWGDPEELLGALVLLASPASDFINGQVIYVDGGLSAAI